MSSVTDGLVSDLRAIFAGRLRSVCVYGRHAGDGAAPPGTPIHSLALVGDAVGLPDLEGCARVAAGWLRKGLAVPLVIGEREFARSLDAFPVEFGAILASHRVIYGGDPFAGLSVPLDDLRRACEVDAKGHLLHLREAFIEAAGSPAAIAAIIEASAAPLRSLLTNMARLDGVTTSHLAAVTGHATATLGPAHGRTIANVLSLAETPLGQGDAARLFPAYLAAAEALANYVDVWRH